MQQATHRMHRDVSDQRKHDSHAAQLLQRVIALAELEGPLANVQQRLAELTSLRPPPASSAMRHLMVPGGKALRPLLTMLCARAVGGRAEQASGCAVAAELIHNATLLHDDVIDDGQQRRGRAAPRVIWGNTVSVLSGDLLFVSALQLAATQGPPGALVELLETVGKMVEAEVTQFRHRGRLDLDLPTYERIIEHKTAALFCWCARAGAQAGRATPAQVDALGRYARHVGIAFQLRDDVLDLTADPTVLGKSLGADLAEGKLTLPVLHALSRRPHLAELLEQLRRSSAATDLATVRQVATEIDDAGGLAAARRRIDDELLLALAALQTLDRGPATRVLESVVEIVATRQR